MRTNIETSDTIEGLRIITPDVFRDFRGEYVKTFAAREYVFRDRSGEPVTFVEDDISVSRRGVLRGLHGDPKTWKLIQCLHGEFFFAVADMRRDSPTYLNWQTFTLSDKNRKQVLVPAGCANGHLCLSEACVFSYKQSEYYTGSDKQFTVRWDEPKLGIKWPVASPELSARDAGAAYLEA